MKAFRDIRVLPVVLVAIFGLAVLKIAGLVIDGGYVFDYRPELATPSWAQDVLNFPGRNRASFRGYYGLGPGETQGGGRRAGRRARSRESRFRCAPGAAAAASNRLAFRAGDPRAAAGAPTGARYPRARNRHSREPAEGRGKTGRGARRGVEGDEAPDHYGGPAEK